MILDTHKEVKHLVDAGMKEKEAEAVIDLVVRSDGHLATKRDLSEVESRLKVEIQSVYRCNQMIFVILLLILTILASPLINKL